MASATASAVMLTRRRTVAEGVRMCTGRAAPSRIGPMVTPPPEAVFNRLNEMFAASSEGMMSRFASVVRRESGNSLSRIAFDNAEIDDHYLTFMVRLPVYPEDVRALMDRLDRVSDPFDAQFTTVSGSVLVTTDFQPVSVA